jgi:archaellum component FlaC
MAPSYKPTVASVAADVDGLKSAMETVHTDIRRIYDRYDTELTSIRREIKENRDAIMDRFDDQDKTLGSILQANAAWKGSESMAKYMLSAAVMVLGPLAAWLGLKPH